MIKKHKNFSVFFGGGSNVVAVSASGPSPINDTDSSIEYDFRVVDNGYNFDETINIAISSSISGLLDSSSASYTQGFDQTVSYIYTPPFGQFDSPQTQTDTLSVTVTDHLGEIIGDGSVQITISGTGTSAIIFPFYNGPQTKVIKTPQAIVLSQSKITKRHRFKKFSPALRRI